MVNPVLKVDKKGNCIRIHISIPTFVRNRYFFYNLVEFSINIIQFDNKKDEQKIKKSNKCVNLSKRLQMNFVAKRQK